MAIRWRGAALVGAVLLVAAAPAAADVRIPHVFGDNMVLQRGMPVPVWGRAAPGEEVIVTVAGQSHKARAGADGRWKVVLDKLEAGGPLEMTLEGSSGTRRVLRNVLVGEVWLGSGQSNMEMSVAGSKDAQKEIAAADHPRIRLFTVPKLRADGPQPDCQGEWVECSPKTVPHFSAAAYYFGRKLHQDLGVPVGLIHSSWGGTPIESWMNPQASQADPTLKGIPGISGVLYNGMIAPVAPYALRGAVWYQGEANVRAAYRYQAMLSALIRQWRTAWGGAPFPFGIVEIAPFRYGGADPACCPEVWEAELRTSQAVPNTGLVVTTDIGDPKDIHPKDKPEVGRRLALWALARVYDKEIVYSGPIYRAMKVEGNKVRLEFDHVGGGLVARDGKPLTYFTIAGSDQKFHPAKAEIDGTTVVVSAEEVLAPVAVRFAWQDDAMPNLFNKEGLPAAPFRTDTWRRVTEPKP
jgi:sialate O-acetylesterase